jgi:hypothetical protein
VEGDQRRAKTRGRRAAVELEVDQRWIRGALGGGGRGEHLPACCQIGGVVVNELRARSRQGH